MNSIATRNAKGAIVHHKRITPWFFVTIIALMALTAIAGYCVRAL